MMKTMRKFVWALLALLLVSTLMLAQNKPRTYYNSHGTEILPDAQTAFRSGNYERTVELCNWYSEIIGDPRADALREKARTCARLASEIQEFLTRGQKRVAREKAQEILAINMDDAKAWKLISDEEPERKVVSEIDVEDAVEEDEVDTIPFQIVDQKPSFNGGDANEFSKWVNEHLVYPPVAKENGVQGRVTLQFTVEADGRVTGVKVLRGVDESLDAEAVRVVSSSPRWVPGRQRDRIVRVTYTFPVIFQLR